jgi:hypothetical protein
MVWVFGIDPLSMGETNMVGKNPFWVNGDTIYQDCDNFIICGFTLSRSDSALECIGHLAESMLNYVYEVSDSNYNSTLEFSDLDDLNTWERFYLCKNKAPSNWEEYGVGQIHFSPNSLSDYDWENMTTVQSTWEDWKNNYPNLTGATTAFNCAVYNDNSMPVGRAHTRWWLSLMPHCYGRDNKGYSHNWWDYITSLDYVEYIEPYDTYMENFLNDFSGYILLEKGEILSDLKFRLHFRSGKEEDFIIDNLYNYMVIENEDVIKIENGKVKALNAGITDITLNYDGRSASYKICVVDDKASLYFENIKVDTNSKTLYYDGSTNRYIKIGITAPKDINYSVTYSSEDTSIAKVSKAGTVTAIGKGSTFITTRIVIGDISKEYKTAIISKKAYIDITSSKLVLKIGEQFVFKAKSYGLSGNLTWSVSSANIISINSNTGKVTAKKSGTAYVIVKNGKYIKNIKVTVK